MIKFINQTPPPPKRRITSGESHPGPESHPGHNDVRDLGDGPWRKQRGGVNLKKKSFLFFWANGGDTRREERKEEMLCRKKLDV